MRALRVGTCCTFLLTLALTLGGCSRGGPPSPEGPGDSSSSAADPAHPDEERRTWVQSVAVQQFELGILQEMGYALDSARAFEQFWADSPKTVVTLSIDDDATRADLLGSLREMAMASGRNDLVLVQLAVAATYDEDGRLRYLVHDSNPESPAETSLSSAEIRGVLESSDAELIVVVQDLLLDDDPDAPAGDELESPEMLVEGARSGFVTFVSDGSPDNGGALTQQVVRGLEGEADQDGDGVVTIMELDAHVTGEGEFKSAGRLGRDVPLVATGARSGGGPRDSDPRDSDPGDAFPIPSPMGGGDDPLEEEGKPRQ